MRSIIWYFILKQVKVSFAVKPWSIVFLGKGMIKSISNFKMSTYWIEGLLDYPYIICRKIMLKCIIYTLGFWRMFDLFISVIKMRCIIYVGLKITEIWS